MKVKKYISTIHDYLMIEDDFDIDKGKMFLDRKNGFGADFLIVLNSCSYYDCDVKIYNSNGLTFDNGALLVVGYILSMNEQGNHFIISCNNESYEIFVNKDIITLMKQNPLVIKKCYFAKIDRYVYRIENKNYMLGKEKMDNIVSIELLGDNKFNLIGDNLTSNDYLNAYVLLKHKGIYRGTCYSNNMLFYSTFLHNIFITSKVEKVYEIKKLLDNTKS